MKILKIKKVVISAFVCIMLLLSVSMVTTFSTAQAEDISGLKFSLINNSTEYNVSAANKTITQAIIPSTYNDLPVTEIAANGFMSCTALEKVKVPNSVKKVGTAAFINCSNLKAVSMISVTNIGQNSFAMCPKLDNFIIPRTVTTMGATVLRNTINNNNTVYVRADEETVAGWSATWASNFPGTIKYDPKLLVYEDVLDSEGNAALSICGWQMVFDPEATLEIPAFHPESGLPIIALQDDAFSFSTIKSIKILPSPHSINIGSSAFSGLAAESVELSDNVTFNTTFSDADAPEDNGTSVNLFAGSEIQSVVLPYSMTRIYQGMFDQCANLTEIKSTNAALAINHLSPNITRISTQGFSNCTAINNLYIPNSVLSVGQNIFKDLIATQTIHMDFGEIPTTWSENWNGGSAKIKLLTVSIVFNANNANADSYNFNVRIMPDKTLADITNIIAPTSPSHNFTGKWYSEPECINEFMTTSPFLYDTILYADWEIKTIKVSFPENKFITYGIVDSEYVQKIDNDYYVEYGQAIQFTITINTAYTQSVPSIKIDGQVLSPSAGVYTIQNVQQITSVFVEEMPLNNYTITFKDGTEEVKVTKPYGLLLDYTQFYKFVKQGHNYSYVSYIKDNQTILYNYYVDTYVVNCDVTFDTIWETERYYVWFNSNGFGSVYYTQVNYGQKTQFPEPSHEAYEYFGGWYYDPDFNYAVDKDFFNPYYNGNSYNSDVQLYAKTDVPYKYEDHRTENITEKRSMVDYRYKAETTDRLPVLYTVASSVDEFIIRDYAYSLNFSCQARIFIAPRTTPIKITLYDVKINMTWALPQGEAIKCESNVKVTINTFGVAAIYASTSNNNGDNAVYVPNGTVDFTGSGQLTVFGGTGKSGQNGEWGTNGSYGQDGSFGVFSQPGVSGTSGTNGSDGFSGGKAIIAKSIASFSTGKVTLVGGTGGIGGSGGGGGRGGKGGDGWFGDGKTGGNGGAGGNGGNGGAGGEAVEGSITNHTNLTIQNGSQGRGGNGGNGGNAGYGGRNGLGWNGSNMERGPSGIVGAGGKGGNPGGNNGLSGIIS